jgi:hypothetical protein
MHGDLRAGLEGERPSTDGGAKIGVALDVRLGAEIVGGRNVGVYCEWGVRIASGETTCKRQVYAQPSGS